MSKLKVIDLFAGCGGLSLGFLQSNFFDVQLAIDNDKMALETLKYNHPETKTIWNDIRKIDVQAVHEETGDVDVIIGGPPCQGLSLAGPRKFDDPRNQLFLSFVKFVEVFNPKLFLLENVPGLVGLFKGKIKNQIINEFQELGYHVKYEVLHAADFGVPQTRKRVFFIGSRLDNEFEYPKPVLTPDNYVTCEMALSDLPSLQNELGEDKMEYPSAPFCDYQKVMRNGNKVVMNHIAVNHSEKVKATVRLVPEGGNYKNLPDELKNSRNFNIAWTRYHSKKPSNTIDTGHRHYFHYKYDRVPTVREHARLQSFPDDFIFLGNKTEQNRQVGNAVPPILAREMAEAINNYLKKRI